MDPIATCKLKINKPVAEVFDAVVNAYKINQYFVSNASGDMVEGASVVWRWDEFDVEGIVEVSRIELNRSIAFSWIGRGYIKTNVVLTFEENPSASATLIRAHESGWSFDQKGVEVAIGQTEGWTHMFLCMKAYLEHGIHLNRGGVWN